MNNHPHTLCSLSYITCTYCLVTKWVRVYLRQHTNVKILSFKKKCPEEMFFELFLYLPLFAHFRSTSLILDSCIFFMFQQFLLMLSFIFVCRITKRKRKRKIISCVSQGKSYPTVLLHNNSMWLLHYWMMAMNSTHFLPTVILLLVIAVQYYVYEMYNDWWLN